MKQTYRKIHIGILGCGAIGSGIARSTQKELKDYCRLVGLFDTDIEKAQGLAKSLRHPQLCKKSYADLVNCCELLVEATTDKNIKICIEKTLIRKRSVLVMSVGKILHSPGLFNLARERQCSLLIPSGAIAGIDAIKAASLKKISQVTLTTRKPLSGLINIPYLKNKGVDLSQITKETVIFEGSVASAVRNFPQNINVAATLALACRNVPKITIRIITSPEFRMNSHEIELSGDCGHIICRTDNVVSPDNPKTSYLAVLSGIQSLKDFCSGIRIGT
jgi:aspartate dehydrogenase